MKNKFYIQRKYLISVISILYESTSSSIWYRLIRVITYILLQNWERERGQRSITIRVVFNKVAHANPRTNRLNGLLKDGVHLIRYRRPLTSCTGQPARRDKVISLRPQQPAFLGLLLAEFFRCFLCQFGN